MYRDDIIAEVWRNRDAYVQRHNHNLDEIVTDLLTLTPWGNVSCPAFFVPRTPKPPGEGGMTRSLSGGVLAGTDGPLMFVLALPTGYLEQIPLWGGRLAG